jgi:hypothetical protein
VEQDAPTMTGHPVVDANLDTIGKVTDVLYDDIEMQPRWAVVKLSGLFGSEHFMPVDHAYVDAEEQVVIPWDKSMIKGAPKANGDHILSPELTEELVAYYGQAFLGNGNTSLRPVRARYLLLRAANRHPSAVRRYAS